MHLTRVLALTCLVSGLCSVPVFAMSQADYAVLRSRTPLAHLNYAQPLLPQFHRLIAHNVALTGTVARVRTHTPVTVFSLTTASGQSILLADNANDADIVVGKPLHVLARIPPEFRALNCLGVTPVTAPVASASVSAQPEIVSTTLATSGPALDNGTHNAPRAQSDTRPASLSLPSPRIVAAKSPHLDALQAAPSPTLSVAWCLDKVRQIAHAIPTDTLRTIVTAVLDKSKAYGVDPRLLLALIAQESRFNPHAVSPVGARGLGQLMPGTASLLGVTNPFDIAQNIEATARYLTQQLRTYHGNIAYALAAYNAGPGNVNKYGGIPPFLETQHYVQTISTHYQGMVEQSL